MNLFNTTGYGAVCIPSMGRDGSDLVVAITAARFLLPHPAADREQALEADADQPEPPLADVYCGPPGRSGLRIEGQTVFGRPATDITVAGHARAPHDIPVGKSRVAISVGSCALQALILGDRVWDGGMTPPEPFVAMPLVWERAFGGSIYDADGVLIENDPRNPVGRGRFPNEDAASGIPYMPNIEDPQNPVRSPADRPVPVGFGPVARWWQPRISYAGTYDDVWMRDRAPVWPNDLDERFFCAAPASLQAVPHLRGAEPVSLEGLHRDGPMRFRLPGPRMVARFRFADGDLYRRMVMDAVIIEPDTGHLTLIHRAAVPATPGISAHRETAIRHIESWEDMVA